MLRIISSSPGDLQPVFETILANATRLCEAKFGTLYRSEGDALRAVALHGAPPSFAEERRRYPVIRPGPDTTLGRALATKQAVQIADVQDEPVYLDAPSGARTVVAVTPDALKRVREALAPTKLVRRGLLLLFYHTQR